MTINFKIINPSSRSELDMFIDIDGHLVGEMVEFNNGTVLVRWAPQRVGQPWAHRQELATYGDALKFVRDHAAEIAAGAPVPVVAVV